MALPSVVPPSEVVVSRSVLISAPPVSLMLPPDVNVTKLEVPEVIILFATEILFDPEVIAVKLFNVVVVPIAPKESVDAPEFKLKLFVSTLLLLAAPIVRAAPAVAIEVFPATVIAPKVNTSALVLIVAAVVVALAVLTKPPLNVNVSPPFPSVTPAVFKNVT